MSVYICCQVTKFLISTRYITAISHIDTHNYVTGCIKIFGSEKDENAEPTTTVMVNKRNVKIYLVAALELVPAKQLQNSSPKQLQNSRTQLTTHIRQYDQNNQAFSQIISFIFNDLVTCTMT